MRIGRYVDAPDLSWWKGPTPFYFPAELARTPVDSSLVRRATEICHGQRRVLGLGLVEMPALPWHYEPNARACWPRVASPRVLANADARWDPRLTWELNRGHDWVILARVYAATGEERFLEQLTNELESWRATNPLGVGINWLSAMEAAIRIHALAWIAGLLRERNPALLHELARMMYEHACFVERNQSEYSSANNHLLVELSSLIVAGRALGPVPAARRWHVRSIARLSAELPRQTFNDGINVEMATHYHAFVLEALLLVAYLERAHGEPCVVLEGFARQMGEYLDALRCSDESVLEIGDNDEGHIIPLFAENHATELVTSAAYLSSAQHPARITSSARMSAGAFWLTGGERIPTVATPRRSRVFRHGGQVVLRGELLTVGMDAGPFGYGALAAHAHCDALAINAAIAGTPLLVERGTYRYNGDRVMRDRFRATAAHNTLQLEDREQAEMLGPFLWGRRPRVELERCELESDLDVVVASHDGFAPHLHERSLVRVRDLLLVVDRTRPSDAGFTVRYHLAPELDAKVTSQEAGSLVTIRGRRPSEPLARLLIVTASRTARVQLRTTQHSAHYASLTDALTCEVVAPPGESAVCGIIGPGSHRWTTTDLYQLLEIATREKILPAEAPSWIPI